MSALLTLRAQFSNRVAASVEWNVVMPRGKWHGANLAAIGGSIDLDDAKLHRLVANWKAAGSPPLPVYKTHLHLEDDLKPLERVELEKAYGYLTDLRVTAQGLEAKTEWTAGGKALVDSGEFGFWSPEWQPKFLNRRTGEVDEDWLSAVALCSNPFFNSMPPLAAAEPLHPPAAPESHMNEQQKQLRASLGLAETATDAEVLAAQTKRNEEFTKLTAEHAKLKSSTVLTAADLQKGISDAVAPLQAKLQAAEKRALDVEVEAAADKAKRNDGKLGRAIVASHIDLAKKLAASDGIKAATDFLESIPASVPMTGTGAALPHVEGGALTASAAHEKLTTIANELAGKGVKAPMEVAIAANPELAKAAQSLTASKN